MKEPQIEQIAVDDLIPYANNSRKHSPEQVAQIAASIKEFGFTNPLLIDKEQGIIAGHGRLAAARKLKLETVPAIRLDHLSKTQIRALVIADNKLALNSEWDNDLLKLELDELVAEGFDIELTGFTDEELNALIPEEVEKPLTEGDEKKQGNLSEKFLLPPFTVMNAREGWWQERKQAWLSLGIKSEVGRGNTDDTYKNETGGLLMKSWTSLPGFYEQKTKKEKELGHVIETSEFLEKYFIKPTDNALASGTSIFDPVLCEIAYRWFCPPSGIILDPFAGGSVRGIVASKLGRSYIGHELRQEQVDANRQQGGEICVDDEMPPAWICGDSRSIDRTCADVDADFIFSCPPYADLEVYSDDPKDLSTLGYAEFRSAYFEIISKACARLKKDRFACFVVGEVRDKKGNYYDFVGDTVQAFRDAGLDYYNEAILVTAIGNLPIRVGKQFSASRKLGKTHQNILVFVKGDGKKAAQACGDVEISDSCFDAVAGA